MSVAGHHAEWLSLVETSGPFISMPVLLRVFPQGLDPRDPAKASKLREAYEDWLELGRKQPAIHQAWIRHVLMELLEYRSEFLVEGQGIPPGLETIMANFGETLRPDFVLNHGGADKKPLLLIEHYPPDQDLEKPAAGKFWKATPGTRMTELLHAAGMPLGLVTNGEEWMLVYAPRGETTGFASWYADLWMQEPLTLRAFHSLLHLRCLIGVAEQDTLAALFVESSKDQQEVTEQLGYQVRRAVEVLVQAFDHIDAESGRTLLTGVSEKTLYDSALTVMMRLVFLFSAEERGLLLLGDPMYDQHYAVSTLSEVLRERADQHGEEVLERRHDAWCRLLATFRAVHAGVEHEAMRLPPYGSTLFDPDRYPFLEGRAANTQWKTTPAAPLPINNRVVLHLLEALQLLRVKVPGGGPAEARRLSFRALDIEQIGHVYEGLLDHTAKRARETILGLTGSKDSEPEIPLSKLEEIRQKGAAALVEFLHNETDRSEKALKRLIKEAAVVDEHALLTACGHDPLLAKRVKPFATLLREDSFGQLVVIADGSVYVTSGSDRRSTGTHYTPRSLTEPIVQHTLEPLVYIGPAEGRPKAEWRLKSPREILALKVCDMAMGSGAFLVQTCRYMAERLVEAWENAEKQHPGLYVVTPEGELSTGSPTERLLPADPAERLVIARRFVADRCLYGVDINPMAAEMAKLSLWLITLQRERPFTFIDHAFKCGDSLAGITSLEQLENFSLQAGAGKQQAFATLNLRRHVKEATKKREALEAMASDTPEQIATKTELYAEAEEAIAKLNAAADVLIAVELKGLKGRASQAEQEASADHIMAHWAKGLSELQNYSCQRIDGRRCFHWALAFPEIMENGFDAFVGNPPYLGGRKVRGNLGGTYLDYLTQRLYPGTSGNADLCAFFVRRANSLTRDKGTGGFVATSAISEGDTRDVCLQYLLDSGSKIVRASGKSVWPGTASVTFSPIWIFKGEWKGPFVLDDEEVSGITAYLSEPESLDLPPFRLRANYELSYQGSIPLGKGFVLTIEEASELLSRDSNNQKVIYQYLVGQELNLHPAHEPSQWIINFHDWPLDRDSAPQTYEGPVASDFPDCLRIVRDRVFPERTRRDQNGNFVLRKPLPQKWWIYGDKRPELYSKLNKLSWALAIATQATKYVAFGKVSGRKVYSNAIAIIASDNPALAGVLASSLHEVWARRYGGYNLLLLRYSPSDLFDTFPLPMLDARLEKIGEDYYRYRGQIMLERGEGLTDTYNRFHNSVETNAGLVELRRLQVELDTAVAAAYGWQNLNLEHNFHKTKQGLRYSISEAARREVLDRLLALNHQRYEEEVRAGLHQTKGNGKSIRKGARSAAVRRPGPLGQDAEPDLFDREK